MASCCPKTFTGFCLNDNTPIAITIDNGVLISWTNLVTGTVTPGNPPAGTGICEVPSTVIVEIEPLTCAKDSVTICSGDDPIEVTINNFPVVGPLDCVTDSITVCQGDSPWVVAGTVALDAPTLAALETITVNQGTSPWVVSATDFDIRNLTCATDSVTICGLIDVAVTGIVETRFLDCETDSITVCPPVSGIFDVDVTNEVITRPLTCETDSITVCPPVSGVFVVSDPGGATEETLLDVKRSVTDFRTLLDYSTRIDGNPVYVGKNLQTALTSAGDWVIQKLFYDITNRLIDAQVLTGSWDGRAALAWKPAGGN